MLDKIGIEILIKNKRVKYINKTMNSEPIKKPLVVRTQDRSKRVQRSGKPSDWNLTPTKRDLSGVVETTSLKEDELPPDGLFELFRDWVSSANFLECNMDHEGFINYLKIQNHNNITNIIKYVDEHPAEFTL